MTSQAVIVGIDAAQCVFPLTHPVQFGAARYSSREYTLLRVRTDAGISGFACGLDRSTPLLAALQSLVEPLIGRDALSRGAIMADLRAANVPGRAALVRAHSLIDLALWDVTAKAAEQPLHLLLGGTRERIPAIAVAGYLIDVRGQAEVVDELARLRADGFAHVKLMIGKRSAEWLRPFLSKCLDAVGPQVRLSLDMHYSLHDVGDAVIVGRILDEFGIAFFEDPFPPTHWRWYRTLAEAISTPLAAGEDVVDALNYADLLEAVSILRVDPSSCGGLDVAVCGIRLAEARGTPVIPHGFPWTNAQLAGAFDAIDLVEVAAPLLNGDRFGELLEDPAFALEGGIVQLDREPGSGTRLDWKRVLELSSSQWTTT